MNRHDRLGRSERWQSLTPPLTFCDSKRRMSDQDASRLSECLPAGRANQADPRPTVLDRPVMICRYAWKCNRPLAVDGLEMRLQAFTSCTLTITRRMSAQVRVVVRGRIELPTFRFSGGFAGPGESTTVQLTGPYDLLALVGVQGRPHVSRAVVSKALARSAMRRGCLPLGAGCRCQLDPLGLVNSIVCTWLRGLRRAGRGGSHGASSGSCSRCRLRGTAACAISSDPLCRSCNRISVG